MAWSTPKTNWTAADGVTAADMIRIEENTRLLRSTASVCEIAGGTGTAITLVDVETINNAVKNFVALADNGGAATTINTRPVYIDGTTTAPIFKAGRMYTVRYSTSNSGCFFVKANASGTAAITDVLAGKTFSNNSGIDLTGTLPDLSAAHQPATSVVGDGSVHRLLLRSPDGAYTPGHAGYVYADDANFAAANIKNGVPLFGVTGSLVGREIATGTAVAGSNENLTKLNGSVVANGVITASYSLSAAPSMILVQYNNGSTQFFTLYYNSFGAYSKIALEYMGAQSGDDVFMFKADVSPLYVTNTGFKLPYGVWFGGIVFNYIAYV